MNPSLLPELLPGDVLVMSREGMNVSGNAHAYRKNSRGALEVVRELPDRARALVIDTSGAPWLVGVLVCGVLGLVRGQEVVRVERDGKQVPGA